MYDTFLSLNWPRLGHCSQIRSCHESSCGDGNFLRVPPVKTCWTFLGQIDQATKVGKVEGEIGGQDRLFNYRQNLRIFCRSQVVKDPVSIQI